VSSECVRQFFAAVTSTAARRGLQRSHHPRVGFHKSGRNKRTGDGHVERRERITSVVSVTISGFPKGINSSPASLARSYKHHSNWSLSGHKKNTVSRMRREMLALFNRIHVAVCAFFDQEAIQLRFPSGCIAT
jgi:hypothetical protein